MSKYRGPRLKKMRALGVDLPGLSRKSIERRPFPPGTKEGHHKKKKSDYGVQLMEKQKLRINYGVTERYLRRVVLEAFRSREHSGHKLLSLLESRLDNVLFRSGFAPTIPAARQLVGHNHVLVDGKRVNIASFRVTPGQRVSLTDKAHKIPVVMTTLEQPVLARPAWLSFEDASKSAQMITEPDRESLPFPIEISIIVEYYARRVKK
jgi:small subunit ribosomal protein S4